MTPTKTKFKDLRHILLLGEHDKGLGKPFSLKTHSGRILLAIIARVEIIVCLENAFIWNGVKSRRDLADLTKGKTVVALGRTAYAECLRQEIKATYLPHPACRTKQQRQKLESGLMALKRSYGGSYGKC